MAAIGARRGVSFACDQRRSAVTAVSSDDATAGAMMTPDTCTSARLRSTCLCCHGCMVPLRLVACPYFRPCMHGTIRSTTSSSVITPSTRTSSGTPAASLRIPSANRSGSGVTTPMCALAAAPSDGPAPSSPIYSVGPRRWAVPGFACSSTYPADGRSHTHRTMALGPRCVAVRRSGSR